jgi:hypothetical protein
MATRQRCKAVNAEDNLGKHVVDFDVMRLPQLRALILSCLEHQICERRAKHVCSVQVFQPINVASRTFLLRTSSFYLNISHPLPKHMMEPIVSISFMHSNVRRKGQGDVTQSMQEWRLLPHSLADVSHA